MKLPKATGHAWISITRPPDCVAGPPGPGVKMNSRPGPLVPLPLLPLLLLRFKVISGTEPLLPPPLPRLSVISGVDPLVPALLLLLFRFSVISGAEPLLPLSTFMTSSGADPAELPCDRLRMISGVEFPLLLPRFRMISGEEFAAAGVLSAGAVVDAGVVLPESVVLAGATVLGVGLAGGTTGLAGAGARRLLPALFKLTIISAMVLLLVWPAPVLELELAARPRRSCCSFAKACCAPCRSPDCKA